MGFSKSRRFLTFYNQMGKGDDLILIHGFLTNSNMWRKPVKLLSKKYRCTYYDLRGHGYTGKTSAKKYDFDLFAEDLNDLLKRLKIDSAHICGFGVGAMIAQHFATKYPKKVKKLILVDAFYDTRKYLYQKIILQTFLSKAVRRMLVFALGTKGVINLLKNVLPVFESMKWLDSEEFKTSNKLSHESYQFELIKLTDAFAEYKPANLSAIEAPTMIINGEFNRKGLGKQAQILKGGINDSKLVWIPASGHGVPLEEPVEFAKQFKKFIKE